MATTYRRYLAELEALWFRLRNECRPPTQEERTRVEEINKHLREIDEELNRLR